MARIFKSRASAGRHFLSGVMANFTAVGDIAIGATRGDGDAGTLDPTGYTYGDDDAQYVLTTATGAGTYQPVAVGDVRAGTAVGVSPAVGTLTVPSIGDVRDGTGYGTGGTEYEGTLSVPDYSSVTSEAGRVQQICEALVAFLDAADGAGAFYETVGASRTYSTLEDLTDVPNSIVVLVAPQLTKRLRNSNKTYTRFVVVDILAMIHMSNDASEDLTTTDNRVYLAEQIDNYLAAEANHDLTLPDGKLAQYVEPTDDRADSDITNGLGVLWDPDDLKTKRQFTGLVRVAYWVDEDY